MTKLNHRGRVRPTSTLGTTALRPRPVSVRASTRPARAVGPGTTRRLMLPEFAVWLIEHGLRARARRGVWRQGHRRFRELGGVQASVRRVTVNARPAIFADGIVRARARTIELIARDPDRRIGAIRDGAYAYSALRDLPASLTARVRNTEVLYAPPGEYGGRGRPRPPTAPGTAAGRRRTGGGSGVAAALDRSCRELRATAYTTNAKSCDFACGSPCRSAWT